MNDIYKILSISDVITNSSSEVFCYIEHDDPEVLVKIAKTFNRIFGYNQEYEITPVCDSYLNDEGIIEGVSIDLPYDVDEMHSFFKAGIEAILKERFSDYRIKYTNE